jgi:beta-N-acetylhexosaminidase
MMDKQSWIDEKIGQMSIEQKIGQLLVFGFAGPIITPDVRQYLKKYFIGGLRITQGCRTITMAHAIKIGEEPEEWVKRATIYPSNLNKDYAYIGSPTRCSAKEYTEVLNELRKVAFENNNGLGLHFTIDQEGNTAELLSGQRLFPAQMGIAATKDYDLAYRIGLCIAGQLRSVGVNMIHSPLLDVNTNPKNPECGPRAFSDDPDLVIKFGLQMVKAFNESNLISTGKHFPGRGESEVDSHFELPVCDLDRKTLYNSHIKPYKYLIDGGLPAIMIGHSIYPSLDTKREPSSVSDAIIKGILREELGFQGVITTDNLMMAGLAKRYDMPEAALRTIIAGCDLVLLRDESPLRMKIIEHLYNAYSEKRLTEKRIDESLIRILSMRWDMGLSQNGGVVDSQFSESFMTDNNIEITAIEAAQKSTVVLRNDINLLPIKKNYTVLLVEQIHMVQAESNNMYSHPGLLWEEMLKISDNVFCVEIPFFPSLEDVDRVVRRVKEADIIVMTNYFHQKKGKAISSFIRQIMAMNKKVIVVTDNPFTFGAPDDFPTVIVTFCPGGRENLSVVAQILYGVFKSSATLPLSCKSIEDSEYSGILIK